MIAAFLPAHLYVSLQPGYEFRRQQEENFTTGGR